MRVNETSKNAVVTVFSNPEFHDVRTVMLDNEPYFVGKDIADALGYENPTKAIRDHVDIEDKKMGVQNVTPSVIDGLGRVQYPVWINESGLYSLIFSSRLPSAKNFKRWVTSEVLPALRKTGRYAMNTSDIPLTREEMAGYFKCLMDTFGEYTAVLDRRDQARESQLKSITDIINKLAYNQTSTLKLLTLNDTGVRQSDPIFVNSLSKKDTGTWRRKAWEKAEKISKKSGKDPKSVLKRVYDSIEKDGVAIRSMFKGYCPVDSNRSMINMCSESDSLRKRVDECLGNLEKIYYPEEHATENIPISKKMMQAPEDVKNIISAYAEKENIHYNKACLKVYSKMNAAGNINLRKLSKNYAREHGYSNCRNSYYIHNTPSMMDLLKKVVEE